MAETRIGNLEPIFAKQSIAINKRAAFRRQFWQIEAVAPQFFATSSGSSKKSNYIALAIYLTLQ